VPDSVLQKNGPLDAGDWRAIKRHPEIACFILDGIELPAAVLEIVRSHHENLDGSGYPDGLVANQLTLAARIGRVADAFDAMTSTRPYRPALSVGAAIAELRRCSGTQFCPAVVGAMEGLVERDDARLPRPLVLETARLAS
jgi:HD-GYP domain-containing protein (c-di-GMP phosphodiesterase class II)